MSEVHAPWTPEQVANLNAFQRNGYVHPFTCKCPNPRNTLVATQDGWVCPNDACGWVQAWAFEGMADGSIDRMYEDFWKRIRWSSDE